MGLCGAGQYALPSLAFVPLYIESDHRGCVCSCLLYTSIYMPIREDPVSLAKLKELEQYFSQTGNGMLRERIKRLKLPYHGSFGRGDYIDPVSYTHLICRICCIFTMVEAIIRFV